MSETLNGLPPINIGEHAWREKGSPMAPAKRRDYAIDPYCWYLACALIPKSRKLSLQDTVSRLHCAQEYDKLTRTFADFYAPSLLPFRIVNHVVS